MRIFAAVNTEGNTAKNSCCEDKEAEAPQIRYVSCFLHEDCLGLTSAEGTSQISWIVGLDVVVGIVGVVGDVDVDRRCLLCKNKST